LKDMPDNTKPWENEDIDFWVPKKPKQMLVQYRITTTGRVKESGIKVSIQQKYSDPPC